MEKLKQDFDTLCTPLSCVTAIICRAALRHNLQCIQSYAPNQPIMAVIKSDAYGHGLIETARTLCAADMFAVARIEEALQLRQAGIDHPIVVLNGFFTAAGLKLLAEYEIDSTFYHPAQLDLLESACDIKPITLWLLLDTGINRLGLKPAQAASCYQRLHASPQVKQPLNMMSHHSCADIPAHANTVKERENHYAFACDKAGLQSIDASSLILQQQLACNTNSLIRPGIMLYGISPFAERTGAEHGLKPVMKLTAPLISIQSLTPYTPVGYGATWHCRKNTYLGTVAIGYGDGYPREVTNGATVLINGRLAPIVGRISMDVLTIDLGSRLIDQIGDTVILWGDTLPVEKVAHFFSTIPYTLVSRLTARVKRIYCN